MRFRSRRHERRVTNGAQWTSAARTANHSQFEEVVSVGVGGRVEVAGEVGGASGAEATSRGKRRRRGRRFAALADGLPSLRPGPGEERRGEDDGESRPRARWSRAARPAPSDGVPGAIGDGSRHNGGTTAPQRPPVPSRAARCQPRPPLGDAAGSRRARGSCRCWSGCGLGVDGRRRFGFVGRIARACRRARAPRARRRARRRGGSRRAGPGRCGVTATRDEAGARTAPSRVRARRQPADAVAGSTARSPTTAARPQPDAAAQRAASRPRQRDGRRTACGASAAPVLNVKPAPRRRPRRPNGANDPLAEPPRTTRERSAQHGRAAR